MQSQLVPEGVLLTWDALSEPIHIFRRSATGAGDDTELDPQVDMLIARAPAGSTQYLDENPPQGWKAYQYFVPGIVESFIGSSTVQISVIPEGQGHKEGFIYSTGSNIVTDKVEDASNWTIWLEVTTDSE